MILVYCSRNKIAMNWLKAVAAELGEDKVFVHEDIKDKSQIEIALTWKAPMRMLQQYPNLKLIQSLGAGVDHIFDFDNVVEGAAISRIVDPQLSEDMYEFVLALILSKLKNLSTYRDQQSQGVWKEKRYKVISDIRLGIMGLGVIGSHVTKRLSDVGFQCMGWSRSEKEIDGISSYHGGDGLDKMLEQTDFLINILPLTNETRGIINLELIKKIKKGAYIINVGRGPHVVDEDILQAIEEGLVSGAALDVFHEEPLPQDHAFWSNEKIVLTPHIASITNIKTAREQVFENIRRYLNGEEVLNEVSVGKGY